MECPRSRRPDRGERRGGCARPAVLGVPHRREPRGCDRYLLQAIVHDWDDDSCVRFLSNCRDAMAPDGRILVLEIIMPTHTGDHFAKAIDLEMLVDTGKGRERTRHEYEALFAQAGLRIHKTIPIAITTIFELEGTQ
ncbi:MAG: hypothetical protein EXQ79_03330 [Acidimicrobiia bacterium]|nr:hypothetical protein [Acidimicrobiia bacterium]